MFKKSRLTGRLSGNIGYVASKVAQETSPNEYLITELSSFQLLGVEQYRRICDYHKYIFCSSRLSRNA